MDEDLLKGIGWGGKKYEHEVQVVGELHLELIVHDEDVHEEIALEPSCESSNTSTFVSQIVDKPCDELELVHSSSPTARVQTVMTGGIHEVCCRLIRTSGNVAEIFKPLGATLGASSIQVLSPDTQLLRLGQLLAKPRGVGPMKDNLRRFLTMKL